jgi:WD40 repeat protein
MASLLARSPQLKRQVLAGAIPPDEMRMRGRPSKLGEVSTLAWSPDGRQLASGSTGAYLRLWDLPAGELAGLLPLTAVKQLAYAADGRHLVALQHVGDTYDLSVHRLEDLEEVRRVRDVQPCFALAGDQLAFVHSGGLDLELQSVASGETTRRWPAGTGISLLAFSPDGETLHAADPWGRTLMAWRSHDGTPVIAGEVAPGAIRALAIQPDGRARVAAGTAQALVVQAFDGRSAPISLPGHEDEVLALDVSADGRWIASGGVDRSVRLWHFPGAAASPSAATDTGRPVAACPDGRCWLVAAADTAGVAGLDQELRLLPPAAAARVPLAFDRDGKRFLTWRADGRDLVAEWWDRATLAAAAQVRLRPGFDGPWTVNACADGRLLAVSAARTPVLVYETAGGTQVHRFPDAGIPPHRLEFSPDGEQLLVLAWPRQVRIGRIGGGWGGSFDLTTGTVGPAVFSPDGGLLASGGDDNAITLHDPASGRRLRELRGHRSQIVSLAFTPDGLTLASSAADRTLRLWDTRTWRELGVIDEDRLHGFIRFDAAGRRLLVVPWQEKPFRIPR